MRQRELRRKAAQEGIVSTIPGKTGSGIVLTIAEEIGNA